jgi:hypothetical protein
MPRKKGTGGTPTKRPIDRYEHSDKKRINNPPVGLVTPETDPVLPTHKTYDYVAPVPSVKPRQELDYDPHLDPQLVRMQRIVFETASEVYDQMAPKWQGSREYLLAQLVRLVEQYIESGRVVVDPPLFNKDDKRRLCRRSRPISDRH